MTDEDVFSQAEYRCRLEWGRRGAREACERSDALIVVDVLSFSSCVVTAVARGGSVCPCLSDAEARERQAETGGMIAIHRAQVSEQSPYSLSPATYLNLPPGTRVLLPSPNGATCCRLATPTQTVLAGCLLNAAAVSAHCTRLLDSPEKNVTVLACGERWQTPSEDGGLRFALEDYLGAGAILSGLPPALLSPEATVCALAFRAARANRDELDALLWNCASGRELRARDFAADVRHASRLDLYDVVPTLRDGAFS